MVNDLKKKKTTANTSHLITINFILDQEEKEKNEEFYGQHH